MTTFWIFIALVLIISLLMIWVPHFRQQHLLKAEEAGVRKQTNLELFNERLAILEKELAEDLLDQAEFDALKKELEISLLQDIKDKKDESLVEIKPKSVLWPSLMTIAVIGLTGYFYATLGAYKDVENPPVANNPHQGMTSEQIMAQRVQMMEAQVQQQPDNSQAWFNLGHAYISASQYNHAIAAFDKVMELVGTHAELLGPKATAMYYQADKIITPKIQAIIDQSLALDPQDPSTLLLVGMDAFFNAEYQTAVNAWQTILDSDRTDIDRTALMNAIQSAKANMQSEMGAMPNDDNHNPMKRKAEEQVATTAKTVSITLDISPELADKVSTTDQIFIFARATQGPKIPLAATKINASAFPISVTLDDSTSMGADVALSSAKQVEVIAVLSKHGSVKPQAGDITGELASVNVGDKAQLTLNTLVQ